MLLTCVKKERSKGRFVQHCQLLTYNIYMVAFVRAIYTGVLDNSITVGGVCLFVFFDGGSRKLAENIRVLLTDAQPVICLPITSK